GAAFADVEAELVVGHGGRWVSDSATPVYVNLRSRDERPVEVTITLGSASALSQSDVVHVRRVTLPPSAERHELFLVAGPSDYGVTVNARIETSPSVPV